MPSEDQGRQEPGATDGTAPAPEAPQTIRNSFWAGFFGSQPEREEEGNVSARGFSTSSDSAFRLESPSELMAGEEGLILTPSRLRTHSLALISMAVTQGLLTLFGGLLLIKLGGKADMSWWPVSIPLLLSGAVQIPVHLYLMIKLNDVMRVQVGPPPAETASVGLHLQYELIVAVRARSHMCDTMAALITCLALLVSEIIFVWTLAAGKLDSVALRAVMAPAWVGWAAAIVLNLMKDHQDRSLVTFTDVFFIFTVMAALKADGIIDDNWKMTFFLTWIYFVTVFLLGAILLSTLMLAHAWRRWHVLILPLSLCGWLLSNIPLFAATAALVQVLDGDDSLTVNDVLAPAILAGGLMTLFTSLMGYGLRQKEQLREQLLAQGAVWTAHEGVARRMYAEREAAQRRIDNLSEEEVARMVVQMMEGKTKPAHLLRAGANLYKHVTDAALAAAAAHPAAGAAGAADGSIAASKQDPASGARSGKDLKTRPSLADSAADADELIRAVHPPADASKQTPAAGHTAIDIGGLPTGDARLPPIQDDGSSSCSSGSMALPGSAELAAIPKATDTAQELGPSSMLPLASASSLPPSAARTSLAASSGRLATAPREGSRTSGQGGARSPAGWAAPKPPSGSTGNTSGTRRQWQHSDSGVRGSAGMQMRMFQHTSSRPPSAGGTGAASAAGIPRRPGSSEAQSHALDIARRTSSQQQQQRPFPLSASAPNGSTPGAAPAGGSAGPPRASLGVLANSALSGLVNSGLLGISVPNQVAAEDADDSTCVICFDGTATCVFLECGHGGFCLKCAHLLFVRPPNECPACRQRIEQVVELEQLVPVGQVAAVKQ